MKSQKKIRCKSISGKSDRQCSKNALPWSPYCYWHQPKSATILNLIIGAIIGVVFSSVYINIFPPDSEIRKEEVFERIKLEAAKTLVYAELNFKQYFENESRDIQKRIKNIDLEKSDNYEEFEVFNELKEIIISTDFKKPSNSFTSDRKQLILMSALIKDLYNSYQLTNNFLDRYGSVDHKIVTAVVDLNRRLEMNINIFQYVEKKLSQGEDLYKNGFYEQHADFLTDLFFYLYRCEQISGQVVNF